MLHVTKKEVIFDVLRVINSSVNVIYCSLANTHPSILHVHYNCSYEKLCLYLKGGFMVFNATFNNISIISWRSVLLMEET